MKRLTYMTELKVYLSQLPEADYQNALDYFDEYFDEAGPDNEAAAIAQLGTPKEAAQAILADYQGANKKRLSTWQEGLLLGGLFIGFSFLGIFITGDLDGIILGLFFTLSTLAFYAIYRYLHKPQQTFELLDEKTLRQQRVIRWLLIGLLMALAAPFAIFILGGAIGFVAGIFVLVALAILAGWALVLAALIASGYLFWLSASYFTQSIAASLLMAGTGILVLSLTFVGSLILIFIGKWFWRLCAKGLKKLKARGKKHATSI